MIKCKKENLAQILGVKTGLLQLTNLLTSCLEPVVIFCCFCILEKFLKKYSRNGLKIHGDRFLPGTKTKTEGDPEGCPRAPRGMPGAAPTLAAPGGPLAAPGTSSHRLFTYKLPLTLKSSETESIVGDNSCACISFGHNDVRFCPL